MQGFEGAEVQAVGGIDAALNTGEGIEGGVEGMAERGVVLDGGIEEIGVAEIFVEAFDLVIPKLGFDAAEAALDPLGGDEGVYERELDGVRGMEVDHERGGEGFELGGVFAGDDVGPGVDSGFEGVERRVALPSGEVGPVDFWALRRLALIWAWVGMG